MGKKNKIKKEKEPKQEVKEETKDGEENKDKVSLKKCFRDTAIIMVLLVALVGILWFVNRNGPAAPKGQEGEANQPEEQETVEVTETLLQEKLSAVANKAVTDEVSPGSRHNYVKRLCSLEYDSNTGVKYTAIAEVDETTTYFVTVWIDYLFDSEEDFAKELCNLYSVDNNKFTITTHLYQLATEEDTIENRFNTVFAPTMQGYNIDKAYHIMYKKETTFETFFAVTYIDSDLRIHSTNEIKYDSYTNEFSPTSEYRIYESNANKVVYNLIKSFIG